MSYDKDVQRALKKARKEDEANPIVAYVAGRISDPKYFCRVCGPRQTNSVPIRVRDSHDILKNPVCEACKQPCLRR